MTDICGPTFAPEDSFARDLSGPVAGVDEAGRGAWCGPVIAGAVILNPSQTPDGLNDSKKLTAKRREALFEELCACAQVAIGAADPAEIDEIGIGKATLFAMARAVGALAPAPCGALVDGNVAPNLGDLPVRTLIKGDALSLSVAAASIVAKVTRDRMLAELDQDFPGYGWASNKGYGAKAHADAIGRLGVTPHHRRSYAPIKAALKVA